MSRKRPLVKIIKKNFHQISKDLISAIKKKLVWLLRTVFVTKRQGSSANAGFVLPTVAMVSIVVVLMTTAIMYRSFDRAQNASNVRVNEAALSAATPAIDRGRAKLNKLFEDRRLPRATPTDDALYNVLTEKLPEYTFGDEKPLELTYTGQGVTQDLKTAWRFPVDTDNNGKFDSYTLYGIYFKTPPVSGDKYSRARTPLEARTPPMVQGTLDSNCGANTSAILVGNTGWIKQNNELKKSFFVYTATVPITEEPTTDNTIPAADKGNYEKYKGNKSFASIEYQQDRLQIPPNNYAVVYEDDIALTPGPAFNLNGAIFTNSNFLASGGNGGQIKMHQVSNKNSCFYEARNAKIIVGGNLAIGGNLDGGDRTSRLPQVDLFNGNTGNVSVTSWVKSATSSPRDTAYNNLAYEDRIERLVTAQMLNADTSDPSDVKDGIEKRKSDLGLTTFTPEESNRIRRQQLNLYFRRRTRRVPYTEVAFNGTDASPTPLLEGSGETLRPNGQWIYPTDPADGKTGTNYTNLALNISDASLEPQASDPQEVRNNGGKEASLGDRVLVGNNLPELWWDDTKGRFVGTGVEDTQEISGVTWDLPADTTETRTRRSLVQTLADVGSTERDGQWELDAARVPGDPTEPVGGLRVVTGAGIYLKNDGTFDNNIDTIWPDTMPVPGTAPSTKTSKPYWMYSYMEGASDIADIEYKWPEIEDNPTTTDDEANTPYLQMRATAVYHYKSAGYNAQSPTPIACVSSFYVPSNSTTAKNVSTLPDAKDLDDNFIIEEDTNGLSNNGIVYPAPTRTVSDYSAILTYQSTLRYPNGRFIDDGLLKRALAKSAANRTLSEQSAIDAQICALQIKYDSTFLPVTSSPVIPHGAIREITYLDPREVKRNSGSDDSVALSTTYDRPVRDRQPLEIRATVLDLNLLRTTTIGTATPAQEYLIPNSGLIYATRDDALPDDSASTIDKSDRAITEYELASTRSPVDYRLDPTRRPNAIMLVNGEKLGRTETYRDAEKGFILATNLPTYIKGNFNLHTKEEFTQTLTDNWSNFYTRSTLDPNFACRKADPRLPSCTTGDDWRPATVLADAVTLISGNFEEGFRDQGDYDWSHNNLAAVPNGFSRFNNFVTIADWADDTGKPQYFSSYLNNFVTPIVLRATPGAYLTEVCPVVNGKGTIGQGASAVEQDASVFCSDPKNWTIQTACNAKGGGNTYLNDQIVGKNGDPNNNRLKTGYIFDDPEAFGSGNGQQCFDNNAPRRIAFLRDANTGEIENTNGQLRVLGVKNSDGKVGIFNFPNAGDDIMPPPDNVSMPWLIPNNNLTAWTPVLQIRQPFATATDPNNNLRVSGTNNRNRNWLQPAQNTTFNLIVAAGDSPARSNGNNGSEDNGGLHNFVRFIQHWNASSPSSIAKITGAFMQVKKSAYATGPFTTAFTNGTNNELNYAIDLNAGRATGYVPPVRQWGYDVALLSQAPDLFAQKLVLTPNDLPDEYFREVGRDDPWVATLLCAKDGNDNDAVPPDQRPSTCPSSN
ncbi:hormogonium polysaccharide biosynthesis protein HpsA [Nodularia sp. UHCC 0506]|uniref:hormogonium polysaccharide biosynthesis protein HpsA n=1 Tax=Nodularia sp. UHCC 0506 TaxID=3110243 RepID=UPI002B1F28CC|nr:hormogonium polysaccharide biosynthesis protein HpsA [Nodularia sp. UHCC 0506]MEA5516419.1 hormogonium polysaccharide biosynthesis protein HpsA [Nodularia sp. UHCC 0506]